MPDLIRLMQFIEAAPKGTMVPIESLRELIAETADVPVGADSGLSPAEAADWLHRHLGGRKRTAAAVRKVMRTGFRGVVLPSYPYGRERRTTVDDLRRFVAAIGAVPRLTPSATASGDAPGPTAQTGASSPRFHLESGRDPADEIAAAQARFGGKGSSGQHPRRRAVG